METFPPNTHELHNRTKEIRTIEKITANLRNTFDKFQIIWNPWDKLQP